MEDLLWDHKEDRPSIFGGSSILHILIVDMVMKYRLYRGLGTIMVCSYEVM